MKQTARQTGVQQHAAVYACGCGGGWSGGGESSDAERFRL